MAGVWGAQKCLKRPTPGLLSWSSVADRPGNGGADGGVLGTPDAAWEEYRQKDPRVSELFRGARVIRRAGMRMTIRQSPRRAVADGFIGVGDTIYFGSAVGGLARPGFSTT